MKQYIVDAFTEHVFGGNSAAVCVMDGWLPDSLMQNIAMENNLSETAFAVREGNKYHLRWFTPGGEFVCVRQRTGCAQLAAGHGKTVRPGRPAFAGDGARRPGERV